MMLNNASNQYGTNSVMVAPWHTKSQLLLTHNIDPLDLTPFINLTPRGHSHFGLEGEPALVTADTLCTHVQKLKTVKLGPGFSDFGF